MDYVFCPIVDCPTDFFPTAHTPTYIEIYIFHDQFIEILGSLTYTFPDQGIVNPCHFPRLLPVGISVDIYAMVGDVVMVGEHVYIYAMVGITTNSE